MIITGKAYNPPKWQYPSKFKPGTLLEDNLGALFLCSELATGEHVAISLGNGKISANSAFRPYNGEFTAKNESP